MVVIVRIEVDDDTRKAIRHSSGKKGKATRKEVETMVQMLAAEHWLDINDDMDRNKDGAK